MVYPSKRKTNIIYNVFSTSYYSTVNADYFWVLVIPVHLKAFFG